MSFFSTSCILLACFPAIIHPLLCSCEGSKCLNASSSRRHCQIKNGVCRAEFDSEKPENRSKWCAEFSDRMFFKKLTVFKGKVTKAQLICNENECNKHPFDWAFKLEWPTASTGPEPRILSCNCNGEFSGCVKETQQCALLIKKGNHGNCRWEKYSRDDQASMGCEHSATGSTKQPDWDFVLEIDEFVTRMKCRWQRCNTENFAEWGRNKPLLKLTAVEAGQNGTDSKTVEDKKGWSTKEVVIVVVTGVVGVALIGVLAGVIISKRVRIRRLVSKKSTTHSGSSAFDPACPMLSDIKKDLRKWARTRSDVLTDTTPDSLEFMLLKIAEDLTQSSREYSQEDNTQKSEKGEEPTQRITSETQTSSTYYSAE